MEEIEKIKEYFKRNEGNLNLIISFGIVEEGYEEIKEKEIHEETEFTKYIKEEIEKISSEILSEIEFHLHPHSGSITFEIITNSEIITNQIFDLIKRIKNLKKCKITLINGEVRFEENIINLISGNSENLSFIFADGKFLKIFEIKKNYF